MQMKCWDSSEEKEKDSGCLKVVAFLLAHKEYKKLWTSETVGKDIPLKWLPKSQQRHNSGTEWDKSL